MVTKNTNDEDLPVEKVNYPATLSSEDMAKMLLEQMRLTAESNAKLADAIIEGRKPYIDPKVLAAQEAERKERQRLVAAQLKERQDRKNLCPHIRDNGSPNVKWQEHSNGIIKGVCGLCGSEFDARIAKDAEYLRRDPKSIRTMGRAGAHARRGAL